VPFRIFLRVGNDSSLGMLMVGFLALHVCVFSSGLSGAPWRRSHSYMKAISRGSGSKNWDLRTTSKSSMS